MKKVHVLLSTYNGQNYIAQQLDSILNQQGVILTCLIRDDGSTDNTLSIIYKYLEKYENITLISEQNIGYKASFRKLVELASDEYDYYAFSDQDDVWEIDKLKNAIELIEKNMLNKPDMPVLYYSNCTLVNRDLSCLGLLHKNTNFIPNSKLQALVQGYVHGCTMVFSKSAKKEICKYTPKNEYAHDFWIPLVLLFIGHIIYDDNSYILYRQHDSNAFGGKSPFKKVIRNRLSQFSKGNFYSRLIIDLLEGYSDFISPNDQLLLNHILRYRKSLITKLRLIINKDLRRNTLKGTMFLKLSILLSKF